MMRSSAYNLRSAQLTSSVRQELAVKRERAASPDLQALSARPRKKQKTQVVQPTAELSGAPGSARHTRAHDANPHPACLVCNPGGATRKVKIEAALVRHTRAHDSAPHPDCDVCRLSQPAKPSRPSRRPRKALPRKAKQSTCVSTSPTPSLGFDILSSEPDFGPLTPLPADDGSNSCAIVKKEPTDETSACSFSSSLSHLHGYLAGASIPQSVVVSPNQGAYSHPSLTNLGSAPPKTAKRASQRGHSNHASCANSYSTQISPLRTQTAYLDPSKPSDVAISRTTADKVLTGGPQHLTAMRNAASTIPSPFAMADSYHPVRPSTVLPPRLKHKFQKAPQTPSAASTISYCDVSGSGTNASTEMLSLAPRVPVIPSANKYLRPLATPTQPVRSSQLALTSNIEAKLQLPPSSVQNRQVRSLGDPSKSAGSPQHVATHFRPSVALSGSTVPTSKDIPGELRQPSSTSGFRDVYSAVSKTVNHPRFFPREPLVYSSPLGQIIVPTITQAARGSTRSGLMEEVLLDRSRTTTACISSTPTPQQEGHLHRQTLDTPISLPASLPLDSLPTPYDSARSTQTKTTSLVLPSVSAIEAPLAPSISTAARNNAWPTLGWLSGLRPFPAPPSASPSTGPGLPGSFVAPHRQDPLPLPPAYKPSASSGIPRNNNSDSSTAASTILPARTPALQDIPPPHVPGSGDSISPPSAADSPEPVRPRVERSTGQSPKDPPVSDAVVDFVKVPAIPGSTHPGGADAYQDTVKVETPPDVIQTPSAASPNPSRDAATAKALRLAYSSEDEPLIIAVKRKVAAGTLDGGVNTQAALGTAKAVKSGGSKGKRAPRSVKAKIKKEDGPEADLAIDNKPKGGKNKTKAARKIKSNIDSVPPGGPSNRPEGQEPKKRTARKPRKKAQPKDGGKPQAATATSSAPVFDSEWQALWSGPSSLFPCPVPWTPSPAWTAPTDGHARMWPTDGPESPCDDDTKKEHTGPVLMHPPRQFAYDLGSLMAYQGCRWDADGFSAMELSALPWLASTCAPMVVDGLDRAGAEQIIDGPDFSLPAADPNWSAYIQLLTDVPATVWAPFEM